jgi:hypothetical protein
MISNLSRHHQATSQPFYLVRCVWLLGHRQGKAVEQTFTDLNSVIATGGPSLLRLTGYPVGRAPGAHAVGPWAICYTYHGMGTAGL